jgi:hypothetical protein
MTARDERVVLDCKGCGRRGVGLRNDFRRFGWRVYGEHACPTCQGLSGMAAATTDHGPDDVPVP